MIRILKDNKLVILCLSICFWSINLFAQSDDGKIIKNILQRDSLFWLAYNTCDTSGIGSFYTEDVEFYHDKIGFSKGKSNIVSAFKKNLCGDNFRLRREALDSTIKLFLLKNQDTVYAAIMNGEHFFYVTEKGKKERLDGWAKFTHAWILQDNTWKMKRLLSYDHKPAPYINKRKIAKVPIETLDAYVGQYKSPVVGIITIKRKNLKLVQIINGREFMIYPETPTLFFSEERDLTFEFLLQKNNGRKIVVRENGEIVDEMILQK